MSEAELNKQRQAILKVYPHWREKVKKMPAQQITAMYLRLRNSSKL